MSRKKKQYIPKSFESTGTTNDTSANIYMSMLMSENWNRLTKNQQILYVYCKAQYYAEKNKPKPIIQEATETEARQFFTMNKSKWCKLYKIYADGGQKRFSKDMQASKTIQCKITKHFNLYRKQYKTLYRKQYSQNNLKGD